jgi:HD-GYP domain-containing protein (c-di-GMP phosphodiesterase class II)
VLLLADVEFPWDIKSIIRWHHERYDGVGYPHRLKGNEIPMAAQIVGIAEVFDALTMPSARAPALPADQALQRINRCRHWWSERVFQAFMQATGG